MTDEQRLCIECGCPVHYGSRHHHCGMVATKYMARISELERELAEAAVIAAERIAELEGELRSADGLAKFNSNLFTEQARRLAELEHMLSEEPHNIPTKYVQHGGVTFALHGSSSIQAYEELERELDELREDAERYRWLRDEDNWGDDTENRWAILGELTHGEFDNWIDAAMRPVGTATTICGRCGKTCGWCEEGAAS